MIVIAIDGACRRNGKPDCISGGGVFIMHYDDNLELTKTDTMGSFETESTNQRGEMIGLLTAIRYINDAGDAAQIITDSEYLFNTMTKGWYSNWAHKGWVTSSGSPVKNKDLWEKIAAEYNASMAAGLDINFYHVKGHTFPFGKVTAKRLLESDYSGLALYKEVTKKYRSVKDEKDIVGKVAEPSLRNNGFAPTGDILERFVVTNMVADVVATHYVELLETMMK